MLAVSFCLSSCSASDKGSNGKDSLKVYVYKDDVLFKTIIGEFEYQYPDVKVDEVTFDDLGKFQQRFSSEISAGEGPDVIFFDNYIIPNVYNLLKTGAFCDLQQFIDKDESFNMKNYNQKVLDCGLYNGKRLYIPINYHIPAFFTTKELLKKNNIDLADGDYSQKSFFSKLDPYISSIQNEKDKYLFSQWIPVSEFIASSGLNFIDYEKKEAFFDKPEFVELISNYKKINKLCATPEIRQKYANMECDMLKNEDVLFINDAHLLNPPSSLSLYNSFIKHLTDQTEAVFPMPAYNGDNKLVAIADKCMAINSNSHNKQQAYKLIMIALSERIQSDNYLNNLPVNNEVLNKLMDKERKRDPEEVIMNDIKYINEPLPEGLAKDYSVILNNVDKCEFVDSNVESFMEASLQPYFEDKSSAEKAINELKNKIKVYLNE